LQVWKTPMASLRFSPPTTNIICRRREIRCRACFGSESERRPLSDSASVSLPLRRRRCPESSDLARETRRSRCPLSGREKKTRKYKRAHILALLRKVGREYGVLRFGKRSMDGSDMEGLIFKKSVPGVLRFGRK
ncbi:hypothetical protein PFISCL1PPCAC_23735, partial [Pristionchus fissidentatus]